jgi:hypothetical protein
MTQPAAYDIRITPQDVSNAMLEYHQALQDANRNAVAEQNAVLKMYDHQTVFTTAIQEHEYQHTSRQQAQELREAYQNQASRLYFEWQWRFHFHELALQHAETKRAIFVATVDPQNRTNAYPHPTRQSSPA